MFKRRQEEGSVEDEGMMVDTAAEGDLMKRTRSLDAEVSLPTHVPDADAQDLRYLHWQSVPVTQRQLELGRSMLPAGWGRDNQ
jgi:hypothetical protein